MPITPGGTKITLPQPNNICSWQPAAATSGTDAAHTANFLYYVSLFVPGSCLITNIAFLIGATGGTDKVIANLYDSGGTLLANTALAGVTVGTAAHDQAIPLTTPYNYVGGPNTLFVGLIFNGTTATHRAIPTYCSGGAYGGVINSGQTFGTAANIVPVYTFTGDLAPVVYLS